MSLIALAAAVAEAFASARADGASRTVQKVKDQQPRDVVTELDQRLHEVTASFVKSDLPGANLLSEEGVTDGFDVAQLLEGSWLVVDPLDGSNNYALSLPGYGYMAAQLRDGVLTDAAIVLPEHNLYLVVDGDCLVTSQPFAHETPAPSCGIYYAYPPRLSEGAAASRDELIRLIDSASSGLYRSGSACIGLFNLLRGRHSAFVGHGVRLWDALAYFRVLELLEIPFRYHIRQTRLTIVASPDSDFLDHACAIVARNEGIDLVQYRAGVEIAISA